MAGFDESALKRLEALVSKSRSGTRLQATEALELKELKLLKSAAEIAKGRAEIATAKRKIEDREKYRIGGLAVAAGLTNWVDEDLRAAFAKIAAGGSKPSAENGTYGDTSQDTSLIAAGATSPADAPAWSEPSGNNERFL